MPLFNKKFDTGIPVRVGRCNIGVAAFSEEDDIEDFRAITLNFGNKEFRFVDGVWVVSSARNDDFERISRRAHQLEGEKNLLGLKVEVLLDLLAEHASELNALKATTGAAAPTATK